MTDGKSATEGGASHVRQHPKRRIWPAVRVLLRTRIVAGLATVIPLWVTWIVAKFVFDTTSSATAPIIDRLIGTYFKAEPGKELVLPAYVDWIASIIAVLLTLFLLYILGFLTANVFGRRLLLLMERLFENLPLVKTIYGSTKQIFLTLSGGGDLRKFQQVVLVEFPRPGMKCLGFLTSISEDVDTGRKMATIFISTTPNPTTGYMQIVPLEEVSATGWTVEEAVKILMSGGILTPSKIPFDRIHPIEAPSD